MRRRIGRRGRFALRVSLLAAAGRECALLFVSEVPLAVSLAFECHDISP
jgi:hypothetical protein